MSVLKCSLSLFDDMNLVIGAIMSANIHTASLGAGLLGPVDGSKPEHSSDVLNRNLARAIQEAYKYFTRDLNEDSILLRNNNEISINI